MELICVVCISNSLQGDFHYLNNGSIVHKICFKNLASDDEDLFTPISQNKSKTKELEEDLRFLKKQLFGLHLKKLISFNWRKINKEILFLETQLVHLKNLLVANYQDLGSLRKDRKILFKNICDYYPDYPLDWEDRKNQKISQVGRRCEMCKRYEKNLHLHHEVALGKGGSNLLTNLLLLCQKCHHKIHRVEYFNGGKWSGVSQKMQERLQIIQQAISTGGKIIFYYVDREGVKTKRIVAPDIITKGIIMDGTMYHPESLYFGGHCFIDKDYRNFKIERIEGDAEITESVV